MNKKAVSRVSLMMLIGIFLGPVIVLADGSCSGLLTQDAADLIKEVIGYIRIAVPILLIILCASDFVTVVISQEDDAMKKASGRIVKRFIAAAAFFFVPLIVELILGIDAIQNSLNLVDDPTCGVADE